MDVFTLNRVLDAVLGDVRTNMSKGEFAGFILDAVSYGSYTVEATYHLPQDGAYKGVSVPGVGSSLQLTNPAGAVQELHKYIYGIKKARLRFSGNLRLFYCSRRGSGIDLCR